MHFHPYTFRIMAIDVKKRLISLSVARHPNYNQDYFYEKNRIYRTIEKIEPLPYMIFADGHCKDLSRTMFNSRKEQLKNQIKDFVERFDVVGFVVGWPLEPSGLPGANCGRVLHLLDFLAGKIAPLVTLAKDSLPSLNFFLIALGFFIQMKRMDLSFARTDH